ncbi:MAG: hypothetical protein EBT12_05290 [Marivivens sp.]|nr:hypothetical protein [Marivivens sp.]
MDTTANDSSNGRNDPALQDTSERLEALKQLAVRVVGHTADLTDRLLLFREQAYEIGFNLTKAEASGYLAKALGQDLSIPEPKRGGDSLNVVPQPFLWDGVIMSGRQNLLVAPPKVGKSALMVALAGASIRQQSEFLGVGITQHINKFIIVGTDQNESDWWTLFKREGLGRETVDENGEKQHVLHDRVILWTLEDGVQLTNEGIEAIRTQADANPGSLVLIDTYHACIGLLGIEESSSEFDGPARQLEQALAGTGSTTVLVHHTNKSVSGGNAITASRGNNSLSAAVSWSVLLNWLRTPEEGQVQTDHRIAVKPMGRGQAQSIVIELTDDGWRSHGSGDAAMAAEAFSEAEDSLVGQIASVYDHACTLWENEVHTTATEISAQCRMTNQQALRYLNQLVKRGLLVRDGVVPSIKAGRPAVLFKPAHAFLNTPPEDVRLMQKMSFIDDEASRAHEKDNKTHLTHKEHPQGSTRIKTPIELNTSVERLHNGAWRNGWVVADGSNPDAVTIAKLGQPNYRIKNLRWSVDIRPCQGSPFKTTEKKRRF